MDIKPGDKVRWSYSHKLLAGMYHKGTVLSVYKTKLGPIYDIVSRGVTSTIAVGGPSKPNSAVMMGTIELL